MFSIAECKKIASDIKKNFTALQFDEPSHTYTVNGEVYKSVSKLIGYFHEHFDTIGQSVLYAEKRGLDPQCVLNAWNGENKLSTDFGHITHAFGEEYGIKKYQTKSKKLPLPSNICELGQVQWFHDMIDCNDYLYPIIFELAMYHPLYKYAGTADIILIDRRDGSLIIADWKTNKDIFKKSYQNMTRGFETFADFPYNHYQLQFSFYQLMLEHAGYNVKTRVLIWLKKDDITRKLYKNFQTVDVTSTLRGFLVQGIHLN